MCGIFGIITSSNSVYKKNFLKNLSKKSHIYLSLEVKIAQVFVYLMVIKIILIF